MCLIFTSYFILNAVLHVLVKYNAVIIFLQLRLRTSGSDWSDKFSLDTAGSGGSLKCKKDGKEYGVSV